MTPGFIPVLYSGALRLFLRVECDGVYESQSLPPEKPPPDDDDDDELDDELP